MEAKATLTQALGDIVYLGALTSNLRMASEMREGWNPGATNATINLCETVERVVLRAKLFAKHKDIHVEWSVPDGPVNVRCGSRCRRAGTHQRD